MVKSEREITDRHEIERILKNGKYLSLALSDQNIPYILTLNYGYDTQERTLYFHTAKRGLKLEILQNNPLVCGTIIEDHGYVEKVCTHAYRSVVFTGKIEILDNAVEKQAGLEVMLSHLEDEPDIIKKRLLSRNETYENVVIMRLKIDVITGKEGNVS
jgi:nitroimidazol reductase NimA-like FMN-containing flavoprotein (pyridoxamine 5'-phosphate oxidase superfamily)